jgi:large subunit ribosomal protein L33
MANGTKKKQRKITLACDTCQERNYSTPKPESQRVKRLELKKFCSRCGHHTLHRETK